jgi:Protein of unknown function (DUF3108)
MPHPSLRRAAAALLTFALAAGAATLGAQKQGRGKKPAAPPAPAAVPFNAGERLEYAAQWNRFVTAATVKLAVVERRDFFGQPAWHFQAQARTIDPVRMIYTLDDQFDSYSDAVTLESRQYESYVREQSKREDLVVPMATKPDASRGDAHVYLVLAGTQDPLGLLYRLRAHDWSKEPTARLPVFDGRHMYEVEAKRESPGVPVTVAAGNFVATRVALRISQDGQEVSNLKVWVSLNQDSARVPVLIEAEAPFGTVRAELTSRAN